MHLAQYRKNKKQTQEEFGTLLIPPASQGLVSQWERGETRITLDYAVQIDRVTEHEVSCEDCNAMYTKNAVQLDQALVPGDQRGHVAAPAAK